MVQQTLYTPAFAAPDVIQRAVAQTLELPVYRAGTLQAPSAGTLSVFDHNGDAVVDEQAVVVAADVATYSLLAATVPATLSLSDRWQERWSLTMPDGSGYAFWRDAALGLRRLYPTVHVGHLLRLHTELRAWQADEGNSLQGYIDAAWDEINARLWEAGKRPYLIMSPASTYRALLALSRSIAFDDYSSSAGGTGGKYERLAKKYREDYEGAFAGMSFTYDKDQDNRVDDGEQGTGAEAVIYTNVPGSWHRGIV